jgi:hypothetical protein
VAGPPAPAIWSVIAVALGVDRLLVGSGGHRDYPMLCASCHQLVMLSPQDAVVAEARLVIGDVTLVWCGGCIRHAAARMVDELGG